MTQFNYPSPAIQEKLTSIADRMLQSGKGILAIDEPNNLIGYRFEKFQVVNTEETRRLYRQLLLTTAPEISTYISAVILTNETFQQKTDDGKLFRKILQKNNILFGVPVDKGLVLLRGTELETTTQGLDNLALRCEELKQNDCDFVKWRCAFQIRKNTPSSGAISENANVMARFASISQSVGLLPVIEVEILREGDHSLERCQKVSEIILAAIYKSMHDHHVYLEGTILLTNMITQGKTSKEYITPTAVAKATIKTIRRCVPPSVPGITFLSGGQSEEMATINLNAINTHKSLLPWKCTFAFGRALQNSALKTWAVGLKTDARYCVCRAQNCLILRAKLNSNAAKGQFDLLKAF